MKRFLTIGGSDCSGGAGIQADIRIAVIMGYRPLGVITAITAQDSGGVRDVMMVPHELVASQLDAVFSDGIPDVIKIGMLGDENIVRAVAQKLREVRALSKSEVEPSLVGGMNGQVMGIVLDPVIMSTSGYRLLSGEGVEVLEEELIPLCDVITPNIPEAESLCGCGHIDSKKAMEEYAAHLSDRFGVSVIITGGHSEDECNCDDLLYENGATVWITGKRVKGENTHGTGCVFSSALACGIGMGRSKAESISAAKGIVSEHIMLT